MNEIKDAQGEMSAILTKNLLTESQYSYRPGTAPVATSKSFGPATSWVFGKNLSVRFITNTDYQILDPQKKPITAHIKRDVGYAMAHVGNKWLIDGWTINRSKATITQG